MKTWVGQQQQQMLGEMRSHRQQQPVGRGGRMKTEGGLGGVGVM
jgi:hypothetical protein